MLNIGILFSSLSHQIWRRYYHFFNKEKISVSIKERNGRCKRCGQCCQASIRCPKLLYDENNLAMCSIHTRRPGMCELYPYNNRDFFSHIKDTCGFFYKPEVEVSVPNTITRMKRPQSACTGQVE
ncbi:MAG: hypothetical protein GY941_09855 [Planctomycetes bacterium]|nr:hypothetical protein [Planctomycetota bacterium]